jgi:hypothetical protein
MNTSAHHQFWHRHGRRVSSIASDLWLSFCEALIVMAIVHVPLALRIIWVLIGNEQSALEPDPKDRCGVGPVLIQGSIWRRMERVDDRASQDLCA